MRRVLIHFAKENYEKPIINEQGFAVIADSEAKHLTQVLRLSDGDEIFAITPFGYGLNGKIKIEKRQVLFLPTSLSKILPPKLETVSLTAVISILKGDAMEWTIEKLTELGVQNIIPIITERTAFKLKGDVLEKWHDRWQKIADQSLKQCERLQRLDVHAPTLFNAWVAEAQRIPTSTLFLDERSNEHTLPASSLFTHQWFNEQKVLQFVIGPEGGWTEQERTQLNTLPHFKSISLGPLILRAETAAIATASLCAMKLRSILDTESHNRSN